MGSDQEQTNLSIHGNLLVFQRVALGDVMARPELWVYNLGTREHVGRVLAEYIKETCD